MKRQIKFLKDGIVDSISHAIAHGMLADNNFDRFYYLDLCRQLFTTLEIDHHTINSIIRLANKKGVMEYNMIKSNGGTLSEAIMETAAAAQIHPAATPMLGKAEELSELLSELIH